MRIHKQIFLVLEKCDGYEKCLLVFVFPCLSLKNLMSFLTTSCVAKIEYN